MTTPARRVAVPLGLAVGVVVLVAAGRGDLAAPPLSPDGFGSWVEASGAITAAMAVARLLALVVVAWLAATIAVAAGARLAGAAGLAAAAERGLPAPVRRALSGLAGASVASVVVLGGVGNEAPAGPPDAGEPLVLLPADDEGTATMTVLAPEPAPARPPAAPASPAPVVDEWVVAPGESFWSIAEEVLGDALGRPVTDAEIARYWRLLVGANGSRLVTPDPDLVHPGQVFVLPPPTA